MQATEILGLACVIATSLVGGMMLFYCIVLGRFFDYLVRRDETEVLRDYYAGFRAESRVVGLYAGVWFIQVELAVATGVALWGEAPALVALAPALAPLVLVLTHSLTGFRSVEHKVNSATDLSSQTRARYLKLNLPLHLLHVGTYTTGAIVLLVHLMH